MARPLTQSDLIFPSQSLNFSSTLHSLKRSALSITNRLSSITSDSSFVISVSEAYNLPLVANERCGSWYIPPEKKSGGVYFKSTDGHMNQWSFNLRRLNLQVLDLVGGGAGG
jgi:tRNA A64-2'-O-ribosylphosphate transferase